MQDAGDSPNSSPVVVLVAEDEALVQEVVIAALEDAGFSAIVASSGDQALSILTKDASTIRALVTDIDLRSQITGWDVARHARELNPDLPVVYMTGDRADDWPPKASPTAC
jgi:CheY-like chemotaxis protein